MPKNHRFRYRRMVFVLGLDGKIHKRRVNCRDWMLGCVTVKINGETVLASRFDCQNFSYAWQAYPTRALARSRQKRVLLQREEAAYLALRTDVTMEIMESK